jgi:ATP-dependent DNA ligase
LWSRNGKDLTDKFPDVQAALARQVTVDCVLDGVI